jgi:hypothetical protein
MKPKAGQPLLDEFDKDPSFLIEKLYKGRDTGDGLKFEHQVGTLLINNGYRVKRQVDLGLGSDGVRHKVDFSAEKDGETLLIESKWQATSGTGDKVPFFDLSRLAEALERHPEYCRAIMVMGGDGYTANRKVWFVRQGWREKLSSPKRRDVAVMTLDKFHNDVYRGKL